MNPSNKYVTYLDGLRGYAIFFVLLAHFELCVFSLAQFGVTVFFFVSGYLITKLLIYEFNKHKTIKIKDFYIRRVLRLYPALFLMIILSCITILIFGYKIIWGDILSGLFYFTNYYLVYFAPVLSDANYLLVSKILWSLSVEEHFYFLYPVLFAFLYKRGSVFLYFIFSLLVLLLVVRMFSDPSQYLDYYYLTHTRADSILYGCAAALILYHYQSASYIRILKKQATLYIATFVLVGVLLFRNALFQGVYAYTVQGIALAFVIPWLAFANPKHFFYKLVDNKLAIWIGKLSYSLYLFHWVSLKIGNLLFDEKNLRWYLVVVPLTFILSVASYYLVELPFLSLRKKFGSNAVR